MKTSKWNPLNLPSDHGRHQDAIMGKMSVEEIYRDLEGHCVGWHPIMYNQRKTMLEVEILKGRKNEFIVKGCCNKM